jgi:hypothetical protein
MFSLHFPPRTSARIQPVIEVSTMATEGDRLSGGTLQEEMSLCTLQAPPHKF